MKRLVEISSDDNHAMTVNQIEKSLAQLYGPAIGLEVTDKTIEINSQLERLNAAIRLKNIELARSAKELAHAKMSYWGMKLDKACTELEKAEKISQGTQ